MKRPPERPLLEHRDGYSSEYAAISEIARKLGITTPETLRKWVRQAEIDSANVLGARRRDRREPRNSLRAARSRLTNTG